ncbi:MAG: addiction module protein [Bacteroidia bacterium]|nr:addiction module protein [Bacteroidia bacterium]
MTKLQMSELHKLSVKDKIKVVQTLWDDIAKEQSIEGLPAVHKKILDERLNKITSGNAIFKPWSEVQIKYGRLQ